MKRYIIAVSIGLTAPLLLIPFLTGPPSAREINRAWQTCLTRLERHGLAHVPGETPAEAARFHRYFLNHCMGKSGLLYYGGAWIRGTPPTS